MNEYYTDKKNRKHKVIQTIRKTAESRETAEREIVETLFKIFSIQTASK